MAKKTKKPATIGRPKIYDQLSQPTTIRMETSLLKRLDKQCQRLGLLRSQGVAQAVAKWLEE
jgi:hypothetical protein